MDKTGKEGTAVVRDHKKLAEDEQHTKELLEDRMKCIATELENEEEKQGTKKKKVEPYCRFPVSNEKPTREHLLIREHHDAAKEWEMSMHAKYMEGQVAEMMSKIMDHVNAKTEFPPSSQLYHNWTEELMDHARTGWHKYKTFFETLEKYPMQTLDQVYRGDTEEWILFDRSGSSKGKQSKKRKKNDE